LSFLGSVEKEMDFFALVLSVFSREKVENDDVLLGSEAGSSRKFKDLGFFNLYNSI